MSPDLAPEQPDLAGGPWHLHLIGVGGAGMNGMASMLVAMGHHVSGSDVKGSAVLKRLSALGRLTHRLRGQDREQAIVIRIPGHNLQRFGVTIGVGIAQDVDRIGVTPGRGQDPIQGFDRGGV